MDFTDKLHLLTQPTKSFSFSSKREKCIETTCNYPAGIIDTVKSHHTTMPATQSHQLLTNSDPELMDCQLPPLCPDSHGATVNELSAALHSHSWYGFDLDDTLHSFRKAAKAAATEVINHISSWSHIPANKLATSYSQILTQTTANAFTDGRTSEDYRKERFAALLQKHGLEADGTHLNLLAGLYKPVLANALEPKPGALTLLPYLRSIGKNVVVVTEGPQDAQEWTLEELGLSEHIDMLITSSKFGKSKSDGLFQSVLGALDIEGKDMVYIGDNYARDIVPAREQGITTIHFSGGEDEVLARHGTRVNSLLQIESVLRLRDRKSKGTVTE